MVSSSGPPTIPPESFAVFRASPGERVVSVGPVGAGRAAPVWRGVDARVLGEPGGGPPVDRDLEDLAAPTLRALVGHRGPVGRNRGLLLGGRAVGDVGLVGAV